MQLGDLADAIFWEPLEGSHMVSQMVSEINLSVERAAMESDSLSSDCYCEASLAEDGSSFSPHYSRARRPSISQDASQERSFSAPDPARVSRR